MIRCLSCFQIYDENYGVCPHCGAYDVKAKQPIHLTPGTKLLNRYLIGQEIGAGGFGIIYKAWDTKLDCIVAIKEYFPSRLCFRAEGTRDVIVNGKSKEEFDYRKTRFLVEARNMAKFGSNKNIPNVYEFFEDNNTAYIVMELLIGETLSEYMHKFGSIDISIATFIAGEIANALEALHANGIIHRDVAPDNVFICTEKEIKVKIKDKEETIIDIGFLIAI